MRKIFVVVMLVLIAGMVPAKAQAQYPPYPFGGSYPYGYGYGQQMVWQGDYLGVYGPQGFRPVYQCSGRQRWERAIGTTAIAAAIGGIFGGKRGAIAGATAGAGYALYQDADCRPVDDRIVVSDPDEVRPPMPTQPSRPGPPQFQNTWNDRLRDQAEAGNNPWFGSHKSCLDQGMFTLKNESGEVIRVFKGDDPYVVLQPRQSECGDPFASYTAEKIVAVSDGYTATSITRRTKPEGREGGVWVWR